MPAKVTRSAVAFVTPTLDRPEHHQALYETFRAQRLPHKRLYVLDESRSPSPFFTRLRDRSVAYVFRPAPPSDGVTHVGRARNLVNAMVSEPVIMHLDDDDQVSPDYAPFMLSRLGDADLCKLDVWRCLHSASGSIYEWDTRKFGGEHYGLMGDSVGKASVDAAKVPPEIVQSFRDGYGFSLVYPRSTWVRHPFPDAGTEDIPFVRSVREGGGRIVYVSDGAHLVLHRVHGKSQSGVYPQRLVSLGAPPPALDELPRGRPIVLVPGSTYSVLAAIANRHTLKSIATRADGWGLTVREARDNVDPGEFGVERAPGGYRLVYITGEPRRRATLPWRVPAPLSLFDGSHVVRAWSPIVAQSGTLGAPPPSTPWRSVGLGRAPVPGDFAMLWAPGGQLMSDGVQAFAHDGPINTEPSHDLAHLIVAANGGGLQWRPAGTQPSICYAEYNAVMLEHLYDKVYRSRVGREFADHAIVPSLVDHGRWFSTKHFTPFPTSPERALAQFARGMSPEVAGRLGAYFFDMKHAERRDPGHMGRTFNARFRASDNPSGWEDLRAESRKQLEILRRKV